MTIEDLNDVFIFVYGTSMEQLSEEGGSSVKICETLESGLISYFYILGWDYYLKEPHEIFIHCPRAAFSCRFSRGFDGQRHREFEAETRPY